MCQLISLRVPILMESAINLVWFSFALHLSKIASRVDHYSMCKKKTIVYLSAFHWSSSLLHHILIVLSTMIFFAGFSHERPTRMGGYSDRADWWIWTRSLSNQHGAFCGSHVPGRRSNKFRIVHGHWVRIKQELIC